MEKLILILFAFSAGAFAGVLIGYTIRCIRKDRLATFPGPFVTAALTPLMVAAFILFFVVKEDELNFAPWPPQTMVIIIAAVAAVLFEVLVNHHTRIFGPIARWHYERLYGKNKH